MPSKKILDAHLGSRCDTGRNDAAIVLPIRNTVSPRLIFKRPLMWTTSSWRRILFYRVTGIGQEELAKILDSGANATAYVQKLEATLHETPAWAALREPESHDDECKCYS